MMMSKGSSLSFPNQNLVSLQDLSLLWFMDQFNQRPSIDMTDLSPLQCRSFLVMSIRWNRDVLPWRRFVSGAFFRCRWIFRLSTGDCPLTQGYGGFTWVFDPGINRVLAEDEEIVKLVIERIIPACLMETKKKSHTQWVTSRGQDHDNLERLSLILNKSTSGLWLHPLRYCWIVIWRLHVNVIKYWLDSFNKPWEDKEESVMMAGIYDRLIVVATNKSIMSTFQNYFRKHRVLSCGVHYGGSAKRCYSRTHFALEEDQKW
ncbi:hypothetical protein ISN44_As11g023960 [Arabidopsis suecica]|uniref:Uncharacterized protein n=1 Tax=Arabidopsis suecica TaxID=45249 RepID=A0A8T1ZC12_ARASU|nr:hypothetical protein ISN44_As11g023960 [Arabidopsis suecica]